MKRNGRITAFYLETLLLIVVFIGIILILTQVFGLSRIRSEEARTLTNAVTLAGNAAEAVASSDSPEALLALLNENENASAMRDSPGVTACYDMDMRPDADGVLQADVSWLVEEGGLVRSVILVYRTGEKDPIYRLDTASLPKEVLP